jgi:hypothetical protein
MANGISVRRRAVVVASVAVVAVLSATTMAGAHQGNNSADVLHLCVKSSDGQMRVVSRFGPSCRRGEFPVHLPLTSGGDDGAALEQFMQDLLDANHPSDLVHWNNVAGVPQGLVDAAAGWLADGEVDWSELQSLPTALADGQVDFAELQNVPSALADGQIDFSEVQNLPTTLADGQVGYDELTGTPLTDSVTSDTVDDGSLRGADLAQGAVTPDKVTAVTASSSDAPVGALIGTPLRFPVVAPTVTAAADSLIAITGQVQLSFGASCPTCSGEYANVAYQLFRIDGGTPFAVSPVYQEQLSTGHELDVASISFTDRVPAGTHGYQLGLVSTGTGTVAYSAAMLNVQLLGVS